MTSSTTDKSAEITAALSTPYYGLVFLGAANAAYAAEGNPAAIPNAVYQTITNPQYMPPLPAPGQQTDQSDPATVPGVWCLDWGPANTIDGTGDNSNLVYIASYRPSANATPYFFVVGIRGTDTSSSDMGLVNQLRQDLGDFTLCDWSKVLQQTTFPKLDYKPPNPGNVAYPGTDVGNIAHGTAAGFVKVVNFQANLNGGAAPTPPKADAPALAAALIALLNGATDIPVVVTGHSLGACLTQPVAAYLYWALGGGVSVIPLMYAPPTAGDATFYASYASVFGKGVFWANSLDVVPYAYITMDDGTFGLVWARQNLWTAFDWPQHGTEPVLKGPPLPLEMVAMIDTLGPLLPKHTFVRPPQAMMMPLTGSIPEAATIYAMLQAIGGASAKIDPTGGLGQLMWQHFPPAYTQLMLSQYGSQVFPYQFANFKPS